jgi:hypothetical protein
VTRWTTLKLEYTRQHFTLVRGAGSVDDADVLGAELAVFF